MRARILVGCLVFGLLSQQAQAYEWGLGAGRIQGCLARVADEDKLCAMGPAMTLSFGLNVWGKEYRPKEYDAQAFSSSPSFSDFDGHSFRGFYSSADRWEEVVIVVVVGLLLTSVLYAFMYPFSSRMDVGVLGRSGWQEQSGADLQLWRNEAGLYMRAYLSQHFPMYIYGSGMFSYQNVSLGGVDATHQVFVKGLGVGFMSPSQGGLYFHGVWERSSFIDPNPKEVLEDSGDVKFFQNSVAEILDGSYFELGYIWYL
jgi:hypothetical protein